MNSIGLVTSTYILLELNLRKINRIGDYFREFILPELQTIELNHTAGVNGIPDLPFLPIHIQYKTLWNEILAVLSSQSILLRDCESVYSRLALSQSNSKTLTSAVTQFEEIMRDLTTEAKTMDDLLARLNSIQSYSIQKEIYTDTRCLPIRNLHRKIFDIVMFHSTRTQALLNIPQSFFKDQIHLENILHTQIRSQLSTAFWIMAEEQQNGVQTAKDIHPEQQTAKMNHPEQSSSRSVVTKLIFQKNDPHKDLGYLQWFVTSKKEQLVYIIKTITSAIAHLEYFIQLAFLKGTKKRDSPLNKIVLDILPEVSYLADVITRLDDFRTDIANIVFPSTVQ